MTIKRVYDGDGGEYIVIISEDGVFVGHEKKTIRKAYYQN